LNLQKEQGLYRDPIRIDQRNGKYLCIDSRRILNFGSNDYLGLGSSQALAQKVARHFETLGASASSSRLVSGNYRIICQAEDAFADYFGYQAALFFPSGFQANAGILAALFEKGDRVFFDKHIHASSVNGLMLSRAHIYGYNHNNLAHLKKRLDACADGQAAVITESLFSMDGDVLPCDDLLTVKSQSQFLCVVDEAHAFGVLGEKGKGLARPVADIAIGTFGKALGLFGAFVLLPAMIKEYLLNFCAPMIYTTTLPAAHAASAMDVLEMIEKADEQRRHLHDISRYMALKLVHQGFEVNGDAHVLSVLMGDEKKARRISRKLLEKNIYVLPARYPTVPLGKAILRISLTALHTKRDIDNFISALKDVEQFFYY